MDKGKRKILFLTSKEENKEELELIKEIREAKISFEAAKNYFLYANDSSLIDYAIYMEDATRIRYMYLLRKAKEMGIKIDSEYFTNQNKAI